MAQLIIIANTTAPARAGRFRGETRSDLDCYRTLAVAGHLPSVAGAIAHELVYLDRPTSPAHYADYPLVTFEAMEELAV